MATGYSRFLGTIVFIGDLLLLNFAFFISFIIKFKSFIPLTERYIILLVMVNLLWMIFGAYSTLYEFQHPMRADRTLKKIFRAIPLYALLILTFIFTVKGYYYSRLHVIFTLTLFLNFILVWRLFFHWLLKIYRRSGGNYSRVAIVGRSSVGQELYKYITSDAGLGFRFSGYIQGSNEYLQAGSEGEDKILGGIDNLSKIVSDNLIDEIYCTLPLTEAKDIKSLIAFCDNNAIRFRFVPDFSSFLNRKTSLEFVDYMPVITLRGEPLEALSNRILKRAFDLFFSLAVLLLIFPWVFLIAATFIKLSSKGPIFFVQTRPGKKNSTFKIYKFRTMVMNEESDAKQATAGDARVTWIGKILRKASLDELPQFINVFLGDMSVVGPRPHMQFQNEDYRKLIDKFMIRQLVKPGITGLAQVKGYRGPTADLKLMEQRVRLDVWYTENWSIFLDVKIIFQTFFLIFRGGENAL